MTTTLHVALPIVVAGLFLAMGVAGLARPEFIARLVDLGVPSPDARNEIRAVYGGFGVAIALILVAAVQMEGEFARGVVWTVAASVFGMAAGRAASYGIERPARPYPTALYLVLETTTGAALCIAAG